MAIVINYKTQTYPFHLNQSSVIPLPSPTPQPTPNPYSFFSMEVVSLFNIFFEGLLCARQYTHASIQEK